MNRAFEQFERRHNEAGGVNVLERRFSVAGRDLLPYLQPGVRIDLRLLREDSAAAEEFR